MSSKAVARFVFDPSPSAINLRTEVDAEGCVHMIFDPKLVIQDAGRVTSFRGKAGSPKATNTVSANGKIWTTVQIDGHWYQMAYYVGHLPNGPVEREEQQRPVARATRLS